MSSQLPSRALTRRAALAASAAGLTAVAVAGCAAKEPKAPGAPGEVVATRDELTGGTLVTRTANGSDIVLVAHDDDLHAFTAVCPHAGCIVHEQDGVLDCPCHGSKFNLETGDVEQGPATQGLAPIAVALQGENIVLA